MKTGTIIVKTHVLAYTTYEEHTRFDGSRAIMPVEHEERFAVYVRGRGKAIKEYNVPAHVYYSVEVDQRVEIAKLTGGGQ